MAPKRKNKKSHAGGTEMEVLDALKTEFESLGGSGLLVIDRGPAGGNATLDGYFVVVTRNRVDWINIHSARFNDDQLTELTLNNLLRTTISDTALALLTTLDSLAEDDTAGQLSDEFNSSFAVTTMALLHPGWLGADETEASSAACTDLSRIWTRLLAFPDFSLGIDSKYTRPGVVRLLEMLRECALASNKELGRRLVWTGPSVPGVAAVSPPDDVIEALPVSDGECAQS